MFYLLDVILEDVFPGPEAISGLARGRVVLVRFPLASFAGLLVDGERLGHGRVEAEANVRDVEGLIFF